MASLPFRSRSTHTGRAACIEPRLEKETEITSERHRRPKHSELWLCFVVKFWVEINYLALSNKLGKVRAALFSLFPLFLPFFLSLSSFLSRKNLVCKYVWKSSYNHLNDYYCYFLKTSVSLTFILGISWLLFLVKCHLRQSSLCILTRSPEQEPGPVFMAGAHRLHGAVREAVWVWRVSLWYFWAVTYVTGVFLSASPVFFLALLCPTVKETMPPRMPDVTVSGLRTSRLCRGKPSDWIRNRILPTGSTSLFTEETLPGVCCAVFLWSSLVGRGPLCPELSQHWLWLCVPPASPPLTLLCLIPCSVVWARTVDGEWSHAAHSSLKLEIRMQVGLVLLSHGPWRGVWHSRCSLNVCRLNASKNSLTWVWLSMYHLA